MFSSIREQRRAGLLDERRLKCSLERVTAIASSYGLSNCPIGGGVEACFIFRWFAESGIQKFQPLEIGEYTRNPYDETSFLPGVPFREFQKMTLPSEWAPSGFSDVWVRIK